MHILSLQVELLKDHGEDADAVMHTCAALLNLCNLTHMREDLIKVCSTTISRSSVISIPILLLLCLPNAH
jgi:hypothetical protein